VQSWTEWYGAVVPYTSGRTVLSLISQQFDNPDRDRASTVLRRYYTYLYGLTRYEEWFKLGIAENTCSGNNYVDVWARISCHDWAFPKPVVQAYIYQPATLQVAARMTNGNLLLNGDFGLSNPLLGWDKIGSVGAATKWAAMQEPNANHLLSVWCDGPCDNSGNLLFQEVKALPGYIPGAVFFYGGRVWSDSPVVLTLIGQQLDASGTVLKQDVLPFQTGGPDPRLIPQFSTVIVAGMKEFRWGLVLGGNKLRVFVDDCWVIVV